MAKRVLSVGQCRPDSATLKRYMERAFSAEVVEASTSIDAMEQLSAGRFDLVLVNRKLDADYSDGLEVLKRIKEDARFAPIPVMIVSNHPEAHEEAVRHGGVVGFGKLEYEKPSTKARLEPFLREPAASTR